MYDPRNTRAITSANQGNILAPINPMYNNLENKTNKLYKQLKAAAKNK